MINKGHILRISTITIPAPIELSKDIFCSPIWDFFHVSRFTSAFCLLPSAFSLFTFKTDNPQKLRRRTTKMLLKRLTEVREAVEPDGICHF